jgi:hypothetical protein
MRPEVVNRQINSLTSTATTNQEETDINDNNNNNNNNYPANCTTVYL